MSVSSVFSSDAVSEKTYKKYKNSSEKKKYFRDKSENEVDVIQSLSPRSGDIPMSSKVFPSFDEVRLRKNLNSSVKSGAISKDVIPAEGEFISIHKLIEQRKNAGEEVSPLNIQIKQASLGFLEEETDQLKRAQGYFEKLKEIGIFKKFRLNNTNLNHNIKNQRNSLIGLRTNDKDSKNFFVNISTTEKRFNKAFENFRDDKGNIRKDISINTFTGMCLFGSGVDRAVLEDGEKISIVEIGDTLGEIPEKKIIDIDIKANYSLYEIEKINRFTRFLNDLKKSAADKYQEAYLITPRVQYYLYLMPAYDAGKISSTAYLKWMNFVTSREMRNYNDIKENLSVPLHLLESPLVNVEKYIKEMVLKGEKVSFDHVLSLLASTDVLWKKVLNVESPKDWSELRLLSYVVGFMKNIEDSAQKEIMTVAVDDLCEKVISNQYARLKKKLKNENYKTYPALGLYIPQNIYRTSLRKDSALYRPQKYNFSRVEDLVCSEYGTQYNKSITDYVPEFTILQEIKFVIEQYDKNTSFERGYAIEEIESVIRKYKKTYNL